MCHTTRSYNRGMITRLIIFCVFSITSITYSQVDTTLYLRDVGPVAEITNSHLPITALKSKEVDSDISANLARLTSSHIQSQGPGYLTTAFFRGQSARHIAIMWEGINIQNNINGTYDLSLLPSTIYNNSKWIQGGNSAMLGNASLAGAIILDDENKHAIRIGLSGNSNQSSKLSLGYSDSWISLYDRHDTWNHSLSINHRNDHNLYQYYDISVGRSNKKRRSHNRIEKFDLDYRLEKNWSEKLVSTIRYWYQDSHRQFPGSIIVNNNSENQDDINQRLAINSSYWINDNLKWHLQMAYMDEYTGYFQPGIDSRANAYVYQLKSYIKYHRIIDHGIGVSYRTDLVKTNFFNDTHHRNVSSIYYNGWYSHQATKVNLSTRVEWLNKEVQQPVINLKIIHDLSNDISLEGNVGTQYHYPSINDLYWPTGGNENLQTEKSYQYSLKSTFYGLEAMIYYIDTRDKILWSPDPSGIWSPENRSRTKSYGLELSYDYTYHLNDNTHFNIGVNPSITKAVNVSDNENIDGKQLIYIPVYKSVMNFGFEYHDMNLRVDWVSNSQRFQNNDNSSRLEAFNVWNIYGDYTMGNSSDVEFCLFTRWSNVFNQDYSLVQFYPQPLRTLEFGVNATFN